MKNIRRFPKTSLSATAAAVAACFATFALANPSNPVVVNGSATFSQTGNVLTVTNSSGSIIHWDRFTINAGETTHFAQSAASSSVLNRVLAADPSVILGTLSSNGRVWLINPAGILVGAGARIDTAGFVASTLNITNADFLAKRMKFGTDGLGGSAGNVVNQGTITTPLGGSVYLLGKNVSNEGVIVTPAGETLLAAGNTVELLDSATPGVKVEITGSEGNATNLGQIVSAAGRIGIAGVIVRNSGTLNASSVVEDGGRIFLKASQDSYVDGAGRIVTTGKKGGSIDVLGRRVAVMDQAVLDASGESGGGKIRVGGDYQGKNPEVQNANITYVGADTTLKANATKVGAGGTVVVWADDTTRAYGRIEARGGSQGGDGGLVETSGKRYLDIEGSFVDTRAPLGHVGSWLLDPVDVFITDAGPETAAATTGVNIFAMSGFSSSTIYGSTIATALNSSSVVIQAGNNDYGGRITVSNTTINWTRAASNLTLIASGKDAGYGSISLTGATINGAGNLNLIAGWDGLSLTDPAVLPFTPDISFSTSSITAANVNMKAGGSITQSVGNSITTNWLRAWANKGKVELLGTNKANFVKLYAGCVGDCVQNTIIYKNANTATSADTTHLVALNAVGGGIAVTSTGSGGNIALGSIQADGGISITANRSILQDSWGYTDPFDGTYNTSYETRAPEITLSSIYGGANALAISADVNITASSGKLDASVSSLGNSNNSIRINNHGYQPELISLANYSNQTGTTTMEYIQSGNLNLTPLTGGGTQGTSFHNPYGGILVEAKGALTYSGGDLNAGSAVNYGGRLTLTAYNLQFASPFSTASNLTLNAYNSLSFASGANVTITGGSIWGYGDNQVTINSAISANNGIWLYAWNGPATLSGGSLSASNGSVGLHGASLSINNSTLNGTYGVWSNASNGAATISNSTLNSSSGWIGVSGQTVTISNSQLSAAYGMDIGSHGTDDYCYSGSYCGYLNYSGPAYAAAAYYGGFYYPDLSIDRIPPYNPAPGVEITGSTLTASNGWLEIGSGGNLVLRNSSVTSPTATYTYYTYSHGNGVFMGAQGNMLLDNASISAGADVWLAAVGEIRINNGSSAVAGTDVSINLGSASSTLYLNDTAGQTASYLWAKSPNTIYLDFYNRSSGGIVIDGIASIKTETGRSGFFVGASRSPASAGTGLKIDFGVPLVTSTVASEQVATILAATTSILTAETPTDNPIQPPPPPVDKGSGGTPLTPLRGATTGGEEGTFGSSSSSSGEKSDGQSTSTASANGASKKSKDKDEDEKQKDKPDDRSGKDERKNSGQKKVQQCA